jgi:NADPH2:quinone reductase
MKAVGCTHPLPITDSDALQDRELSKPAPQGRDLLVRVEAVSVNPVDTKIRRSQVAEHQEGALRVLGWDVAGVVDSVGSGVSLFQAGDEVYYSGSLIRQGANSEYHLVDERLVAKKPASLTMAQTAALPLTDVPPLNHSSVYVTGLGKFKRRASATSFKAAVKTFIFPSAKISSKYCAATTGSFKSN